ncbi:TPM domain-containing protein [Sphingomonas sp.]|uniref:TPM domain-containing protein n=1 Tax=Sphingomonas sp. TaxID=28214 RepID=UPI002EDB9B72
MNALLLCGALAACNAAPPPPKAPPAGYAFPALTGRVVDSADLLPQTQEAKLSAQLASVQMRTKHEFIVVTVPSLGGHSIEDYGLTLGNYWGIGRKGFDDGVLLIVAPNERKVRIEVGKGLEKTLTNPEAGAIIQAAILPRFREQKMVEGVLAGGEGIIREISS